MDFDHRPGEVKLFTIGQASQSRGAIQVANEIAKCDVVCACCHRLRTKRRGDNTKRTRANEWGFEAVVEKAQMALPLRSNR